MNTTKHTNNLGLGVINNIAKYFGYSSFLWLIGLISTFVNRYGGILLLFLLFFVAFIVILCFSYHKKKQKFQYDRCISILKYSVVFSCMTTMVIFWQNYKKNKELNIERKKAEYYQENCLDIVTSIESEISKNNSFFPYAKMRDAENDLNYTCALGIMYLDYYQHRKANEIDYRQGEAFIKKAADGNHTEALFLYGDMLMNGIGVTTNKPEAMKYWIKAAERGNYKAQYNLSLYYNGQDPTLPIDESASKKWLFKAANSRYLPAIELVVNYYLYDGDMNEAKRWLYEGSLLNSPYCMGSYATMCFAEKKYKEAFKWALRAEMSGDNQGRFILAEMYIDGKEVPPNIETAKFYLRKNIQDNHYDSIKKMVELLKKENDLEYKILEEKYKLTS